MRKYQCFISSTYEDLRDERAMCIEAVLEAQHIPAGMEYFEVGRPQREIIEQWISQSDMVIFIIGGRYGTINKQTGHGYLEDEFDYVNIGEYEIVKKRFANFYNVLCYPAIVTEEETESLCQKSLCYKHNEFAAFYEKLDINNDYEEYRPGIYSCFAEHEYSCLISPEGYLYKCLNDICNPKYAIGHVQKNIDGIFAASKYMGRDPISEKECSECAYFPMCYG